MSFTSWENELYHHGVKGQRWGERKWQNEDGSLTAAGRAHYGYGDGDRRVGNGNQPTDAKSAAKAERRKKILKGLAIAGGIGLAAFGAYKASKKAQTRARDILIEKANLTEIYNRGVDDAHKYYRRDIKNALAERKFSENVRIIRDDYKNRKRR